MGKRCTFTTEESNRIFALNFGLFLNDNVKYGNPVSVMGSFCYCLVQKQIDKSKLNCRWYKSPLGLVNISLENPPEDFLEEDGVKSALAVGKESLEQDSEWNSLMGLIIWMMKFR